MTTKSGYFCCWSDLIDIVPTRGEIISIPNRQSGLEERVTQVSPFTLFIFKPIKYVASTNVISSFKNIKTKPFRPTMGPYTWFHVVCIFCLACSLILLGKSLIQFQDSPTDELTDQRPDRPSMHLVSLVNVLWPLNIEKICIFPCFRQKGQRQTHWRSQTDITPDRQTDRRTDKQEIDTDREKYRE